jgi:hypothetical protein
MPDTTTGDGINPNQAYPSHGELRLCGCEMMVACNIVDRRNGIR